MNDSVPDKRLVAVCGLFCPSCPLYIGTHEDPKRLEWFADRFNCSVEELKCEGCRSDTRCIFCRASCKMTRCANEKGLDFCGKCDEYPCNELRDFQTRMPNRIELWQSQQRIKDVGYEQWFGEMMQHYACPECGTLNSAPDIACRKCGHDPSCEYVRLHRDEILQLIDRARRAQSGADE